MKLNKRVVLLVSAILIFIVLIFIFLNGFKAVNAKKPEIIRVEIKQGMGASQIAKLLEENKVIRNKNFMIIYVKLNRITSLQAGKYDLSTGENIKEIINHISKGEVTRDAVKLTFIEGKNMRWYAKVIAENTDNTEKDVFDLLEDEDYIDSLIDKYWFLTEEIKDSRIYYPLEGYLLPETYFFDDTKISVKTIFEVILDVTEEYLEKYKEKIENSNLTVHQILTIASMAELEGKSLEDRANIVGVFYNRLRTGMALGSDVTTYYAFKVDMGDRNLKAKEIDTENPYNTRGPNMGGKIPVGAICNPSKEAIEATVNYTENSYFYFVADKNGKIYFTNNYNEHQKMIRELKNNNLWFTY